MFSNSQEFKKRQLIPVNRYGTVRVKLSDDIDYLFVKRFWDQNFLRGREIHPRGMGGMEMPIPSVGSWVTISAVIRDT